MAKKVTKKSSAKKTESFEACLDKLETVQDNLSHGDLKLDKAIAEYEKGVGLLKNCYDILESAEKKISILVADGKGLMKEQALDDDDDEELADEEEEDGMLF